MRLSRSAAIAGTSLLAITGALSSACEPRPVSGVPPEVVPVAEPETAPESPPQLESHGFSYAGRPVHPAAVMELSCDLADPLPKIAAIDLEGFTRSNAVCQSVVTEEGGHIWLRDEERCGTGFFRYRSLGRSPANTWILLTESNGGGSGCFQSLLFIRLDEAVVMTNTGSRDQIILKCVGEYVLGDRDEGTLRVDGNRLFIGKSKYRAEDVVLTID